MDRLTEGITFVVEAGVADFSAAAIAMKTPDKQRLRRENVYCGL